MQTWWYQTAPIVASWPLLDCDIYSFVTYDSFEDPRWL